MSTRRSTKTATKTKAAPKKKAEPAKGSKRKAAEAEADVEVEAAPVAVKKTTKAKAEPKAKTEPKAKAKAASPAKKAAPAKRAAPSKKKADDVEEEAAPSKRKAPAKKAKKEEEEVKEVVEEKKAAPKRGAKKGAAAEEKKEEAAPAKKTAAAGKRGKKAAAPAAEEKKEEKAAPAKKAAAGKRGKKAAAEEEKKEEEVAPAEKKATAATGKGKKAAASKKVVVVAEEKKEEKAAEPAKELALSKAKSVVSSRGSAPKGAIEVVLSFDTTGSMYACLGVVRQSLSSLATELFKQFPAIRIGVIAHGDYCDEGKTYVKKVLPFSNDVKQIVDWISNVGMSGGGDFPECYELALRSARTEFSWSPGSRKSLVLVGDAPPHEASYPLNKDKIDWLTEAKLLGEDGIIVYAIQALNYSQSNNFYSTIASVTGGIRLSLDQFAESPDFVRAICYREVGPEHLQAFEDSVRARGNVSRAMNRMFDALAGRTPAKGADRGDLKAVEPGRFQILNVPHDIDIKGFVQDSGLLFSKGAGYYQFTKSELIQSYKEVVLRDKSTGDLFCGEVARDMLGLPKGENAKIKPTALEEYDVFVQSTSVNRKLIGGTLFLYEVTREDK